MCISLVNKGHYADALILISGSGMEQCLVCRAKLRVKRFEPTFVGSDFLSAHVKCHYSAPMKCYCVPYSPFQKISNKLHVHTCSLCSGEQAHLNSLCFPLSDSQNIVLSLRTNKQK